MVKLSLVISSLVIMFVGVMNSGDAAGFYSSTSVFYAMLLLDYFGQTPKFNHYFLIVGRGLLMSLTVISAMGVFGMLTIIPDGGKYYIGFVESMKITDKGLVNVHWVFAFMAIVAVITSVLEYIFRIEYEDRVVEPKKTVRKKGA